MLKHHLPRHPDFQKALWEKGLVLTGLDRRERAVRTFVRSYRVSRNSEIGIFSYFRAGKLQAGLGRHGKAAAIFREIIKNRPSSLAARRAEVELNSLRFLPRPRTRGAGKAPSPTIKKQSEKRMEKMKSTYK